MSRDRAFSEPRSRVFGGSRVWAESAKPLVRPLLLHKIEHFIGIYLKNSFVLSRKIFLTLNMMWIVY